MASCLALLVQRIPRVLSYEAAEKYCVYVMEVKPIRLPSMKTLSNTV